MSAPCPTYGFRAELELVRTFDDTTRRALLAEWASFLDARGLVYVEVTSGEYLITSEASQATEADRQAALTWLGSRAEVERLCVGDLEDVGEG